MTAIDGFAPVNGGRLYYEVAGEGAPVVLIHGFSLDCRMWDDQVEELARDYQVIRYDLRGFGRSSPPDGAYSHVHDLQALLDHLGISRAVVMGLSMGGAIALDFTLAYPDATRGLVLADSTLPGFVWTSETSASSSSSSSSASKAVDLAVENGVVEEARARWLAHPFFAPAREHLEVARRLAAMVSDYSGWHWTHGDIQVDAVPFPPSLESIGARTLVLVGEYDIPAFRAIADELARRIPDARQVVLPGVGHMSNMEDPERFNQVIRQFLDDLE